MIFYNGATGGLGRYFGEAAQNSGTAVTPIQSRLEDFHGFEGELEAFSGKAVAFVHLAGKVSVPWCESHPDETRKTNIHDAVDTVRVYIQHCAQKKIQARIIYVSSGHLYARSDQAIHETDPVLPRSVYAKSKLEAENALHTLALETGADLRITRVFGLVAPVQPENYILQAMLKRAQEKRLAEVPGLSNIRDYLDARDVCRALIKIAELPNEGFSEISPDRILNLASGKGRTIRAVLEHAISAIYPKEEAKRLFLEITEAPARADDVPKIVGSIDRYRALFSENPGKISLAETIQDALR